ncbi:zinc finger protein 70-like [Periplaneta americana]|uniref:zinc finger protein 70-like n=1 Tax=Periplaneta americana TaxID=6978 RepID=UPI0037E90AB0
MDEIKTEPNADPLALHSGEDANVGEENISDKERSFLVPHLTTMESTSPNCTLKPEIKIEETAVAFTFAVLKREFEEGINDVIKVEESNALEGSTEENEVMTQRFADSRYWGESSSFTMELNCASSEQTAGENSIEWRNSNNNVTGETQKCDVENSLSLKCLLGDSTVSFKCRDCEMCFLHAGELEKHSRLHTGETPFKCDTCGKCFTRSSTLKSHYRMHTGEKPFKCDVCGKSFSEAGSMKSHFRLHRDDSAHKCDVCGKSFCRSQSLVRHVRKHTGEKPFECEQCGKCFSQSSHLASHALLHTGEKPFKCELCGKCFTRPDNLQRHSRMHTDEKSF